MKNKHLSMEERNIIERLMQEGKSNKTIAEVLGRSTSTIGRELERNCWQEGCWRYQGKKAQKFRIGAESVNGNRGFQRGFGRKSLNGPTPIGVQNRSWNVETARGVRES